MGIDNIDILKGDDEVPTNSVNRCAETTPHNPHEWGMNGKIYNCNGVRDE